MHTYTLKRTGEVVVGSKPDADGFQMPKIYVNRTGATKAAEKITDEPAEVIQRGRPFYVRLTARTAEVEAIAAGDYSPLPLDNVCPDGPSCPDPKCRQDRTDRGITLAPPVPTMQQLVRGLAILEQSAQLAKGTSR